MTTNKSGRHISSMLSTQDSDSGLSMPSGTLRSSFNFSSGTPRMAEEDHERLIQSLLQKSANKAPVDQRLGLTSTPSVHTNAPRMNSTIDEFFLQPQRSSSPDMLSRSQSSRILYNQPRQTHSSTQPLRRSLDRFPASENYALNGVLNESQSRRNVLLEKLKEAQATLQHQSTRLTQLETDYHSSSYQVEELKANESKLVRQLAELEKEKQELNDLRLRDVDTQLVLQDRVKELEGALHNIATDFQLLEADHSRRRELVDQLSTTVELIEEENRKLHKSDVEDWIVEQTINTEVQSLRREITSANEKKDAMKRDLENQRLETKHWKEENEKHQNKHRKLQEELSELKVREATLTHRLESQENKEKDLQRENESLRCKDREIHDTMTDLRSRVAILTSDKERLYQEKSDFSEKIDGISQLNRQLQEEVQGLQLVNKTTAHENQVKDNSISQLTTSNQQLAEELAASQKVGERLSLELTKTKEAVERHVEELANSKAELQKSEETVQSLQSNYRQAQIDQGRLQAEIGHLQENFSQERQNLQQKVDQLQTELRNNEKQKDVLEQNMTELKQNVREREKTSCDKMSSLESELRSSKDRVDQMFESIQRKDDEIIVLAQQLTDYESQVNNLMVEQEARQIDYNDYKHLQEENQRLTLHNRRITQENSETEQMVQLLQTQRDIYARSIQEYSTKALENEGLTEENRQLQHTADTLRSSLKEMESELQSLKETQAASQHETLSASSKMEAMAAENIKFKEEKEKAEQENMMLKDAVQESYQLKQEIKRLELDLAACTANKTVIGHLSEQNAKLQTELTAKSAELADVCQRKQVMERTLTEFQESKAKLSADLEQLQKVTAELKNSEEQLRKDQHQMKADLSNSESEKERLRTQLNKMKAEAGRAESKLLSQEEQLAKAVAMETQHQKLQQFAEELSSQSHAAATERDALAGQVSKLQLELQLANRNIEERLLANKQLASDIAILNKEKHNLQAELERTERRLEQTRADLDGQLKSVNERLERSEGGRIDSTERLKSLEREVEDWRKRYNDLSNQLSSTQQQDDALRSAVEELKTQLQDSSEVCRRQEELIATLKEETSIISDLERELKGVNVKCKELHASNQEYSNIIGNLQKEARQKEELERQLQEIGTDLVSVKSELQKTYYSMNQKELEMERLQQQCSNAMLDADNSEEKCAEIKIRLEQTEKAKDIAISTLQERIHSLEAETHTYKTEALKLERQLKEITRQLDSTSSDLTLTQGTSAMSKESLITLAAERDSLQTECSTLRTQNAKLLSEQNHLDGEKRQAQLQLKETKMDMFKIQKEKEYLEKANSRLDTSVSECNRLLKTLTTEYETATSRLTESERVIDRLKRDHAYTKEELSHQLETAEEDKQQLRLDVCNLRSQTSNLQAKLREADFEQSAVAGQPSEAVLTSSTSGAQLADTQNTTVSAAFVADCADGHTKCSSSESHLHSDGTLSEAERSLSTTKAANHPDSLSDVKTDSSGDSWSDPGLHMQPEMSEALSSGKIRNTIASEHQHSTLGNDEIDGMELGNSPFRVTEIPVTISVNSGHGYPEHDEFIDGDKDGSCEHLHVEVETDSEEEKNIKPAMTRDKTMKIFKQLKKAKQRSKRCLAPTPKLTKSLPNIPKEAAERKDSLEVESISNESVAEVKDSENVENIKEDIIAKSGRVEWRGDPREPHRRFLSSWELSIISDAEEGDSLVETESVSSEYTRSLLNIAGSVDSMQSVGVSDNGSRNSNVNQTASQTSMPSVGVLDSPLVSRNSTIHDIPSLDQLSIHPNSLSTDNFVDSEGITPGKNGSPLPVTSSPKPTVRGVRGNDASTFASSKSQKKSSKSSDSKSKLPKLSLFKKKW